MQLRFIGLLLLLSGFSAKSQNKHFFDYADATINVFVDNPGYQRANWPAVYKQPSSNYSLDTFYTEPNWPRCGLLLGDVSISAGLQLSRNLFQQNSQRWLRNRVEWRVGGAIGSRKKTRQLFSTMAPISILPLPPYTYTGLVLEHRQHTIDINSQLVYKIPSFLLPQLLTYYIGTGMGLTCQVSSTVREQLITYQVSSGGSYQSVEIGRTEHSEAAQKYIKPYWTLVGGTMLYCNRSMDMIGECAYNGWLNQQDGGKEQLRWSLILRYKF